MVDLIHSVVIERATDGAVNDYGVPAQTWATSSTVRGLVQPKKVEEIAQLSQAGPVASTHTVFMYPADVTEADRLVANGKRYQIDGIRDAAGIGHHYEIDAHLVEGS